MVDDLIDIKDLSELLGYTDQRSIQNWCKRNKIPLIPLGKKTYTVRHFIDGIITDKVEQFAKANCPNPETLMKAIKENDGRLLSEAIKPPGTGKIYTRKPQKDSKAAIEFREALQKL